MQVQQFSLLVGPVRVWQDKSGVIRTRETNTYSLLLDLPAIEFNYYNFLAMQLCKKRNHFLAGRVHWLFYFFLFIATYTFP